MLCSQSALSICFQAYAEAAVSRTPRSCVLWTDCHSGFSSVLLQGAGAEPAPSVCVCEKTQQTWWVHNLSTHRTHGASGTCWFLYSMFGLDCILKSNCMCLVTYFCFCWYVIEWIWMTEATVCVCIGGCCLSCLLEVLRWSRLEGCYDTQWCHHSVPVGGHHDICWILWCKSLTAQLETKPTFSLYSGLLIRHIHYIFISNIEKCLKCGWDVTLGSWKLDCELIWSLKNVIRGTTSHHHHHMTMNWLVF